MKKRIISAFLAFIMLFAMVVPAMANETKQTTNLVIHKIVMPKQDMDKHDGSKKYDPTKAMDENGIKGFFSQNAKEVAGVAFDIYKEQDNAEQDLTKEAIDPIFAKLGTKDKYYKKVGNTLVTKSEGVTAEKLENGTYIIVENREESTYTGQKGKAITESKAIPTKIELPMTKPDGTGYFDVKTPLHIYPKNTEEKPQIDKNFAKSAGDLEKAGADYKNYDQEKQTISRMVGDQLPYEVLTKIPAKSEYKTVRWEDTMTKGLTFDKNVSLEWKENNEESFTSVDNKDTKYELKQNASGFTLEFKESGLNALKEKAKNGEVQFRLTYTATINDEAVVDKADENNIKFDFSNRPNEFKDPREKDVTPKEQKIEVKKTWAEVEQAPANVTVKYYLYEKGTKAEDDKVVDSVEKKSPDFNYTFKGLEDGKNYYVKEIVAGYTPEYKVTDKSTGVVSITNTKDDKNPTPLIPTTPKVVTYGKKFVKADNQDGTRLAGADFVVAKKETDITTYLALKEDNQKEKSAYETAEKAYNDAVTAWNKAVAENNAKTEDKKDDTGIEVQISGETLKGKTAVEQKINTLKETRDKAFKALNTQWKWVSDKDSAFKFTSNEKGQFEVTGLAEGQYTLVETKAPEGYALPTNPEIANFKVDKDSYTKDANGVKYEGKEAVGKETEKDIKDAQRVNNKKVTIPQTGGIGTVIFTVAGLIIMGAAIYALKKNNQEVDA